MFLVRKSYSFGGPENLCFPTVNKKSRQLDFFKNLRMKKEREFMEQERLKLNQEKREAIFMKFK